MRGPAVIVVPARAESIKAARDWVEEVLQQCGRDPYVAKLVVSELVTNVLKHAGSDEAKVRIVHTGKGLLVEVHDDCDAFPVPGSADVLSEGGRGLVMMGALVKEWGARPLGTGGKAVWALLPEGTE